MPIPDDPTAGQIVLKFGGGLNTEVVNTEIDPGECVEGKNFDLELGNSAFRRRKPFNLAATATNGERINGFAQLLDSNNTLTTLIQAGNTVYLWDGETTFTEVGTVSGGARLRGPLTSNWLLDDVALIADLSVTQPVLQWDGTTLSEVSHNLSGGFSAKYINVENERAIFANVKSGASATPHIIVGSAQSDYTNLSINSRPDSSATAADAWFLPVPDLKPINGLVSAFGLVAFSTERGRMYRLTGQDKTDFAIGELFTGSFASGDEPMVYAGNDILFGRPGRIESLFSTDALGDVDTDDLSREISNDVEGVTAWTLAYNPRLQKVYCLPNSGNELWTFHKSFVDERIRQVSQRAAPPRLSPWSRWVTDHAISFQPTAMWSMLRPTDKTEQVYMGGPSGEIFQLEGGGSQDGGTADIDVERLSGLIQPGNGGPIFDITGWISYRKVLPATVTLTFEYGGENVFDQAITIALGQASPLPVYGGGLYYNNDSYYSAKFKKRLTRQPIGPAGQGNHFQVRVGIDGSTDFFIQEIGFTFKSTTPTP